jgi:lipoprotein-releasing system permease protein
MYFVYAQIPARIVPQEVLLITIFGIFSSLLASWVASRSVLQMTAAEVLRDE